MPKIDVIVPIRNEAENIETLVKRVAASLGSKKIDYRMIVVDDRSTDNSIKILKRLQKTYPILIHTKKGKLGKAFSVLEGSKLADSEYLVMIDGDCQYPPEAIPQMLEKIQNAGVVVANRKKSHKSFLRAMASRLNAFVFGRLIMGLNCDVQSGLKMFRREIIAQVDESEVGEWSLDVSLLITAKDMGYAVETVEIDFADRNGGQSKINMLSATKDIMLNALNVRFKGRKVLHVKSEDMYTMRGSGVIHKGQKYITHTSLDHEHSALHTFHSWQKGAIIGIAFALLFGVIFNLYTTALIFTAVLSTVYFLDVFFNLYLVAKSLYFPPEFAFDETEIAKIDDKKLPVYSVLVPLYREAKVLPNFVSNIDKIDWPKNKLDVMLLLEEDDNETQEAAKTLSLPSYIRTVIVPHSFPKTKPKACNYGLSHAKGEYVVIYDAEDIPDPAQLKKAYLAFSKVGEEVFCLQAKLNYHNPHDNLLTRFFTAEYSLWFDLVLPGLQSLETSIPLGGTSNHFRTANLMKLQGWDPFNVTEDCDLGVRLFKEGYRTAIIDSVTLEEANSNWGNWIRQRSRWIKGYMQTYLVHMRHPLQFLKKKGIHAVIFQLVVGGKIAFMLINPILWVLTLLYFGLYSVFGPAIESLYPTAVFYMAVTSLVMGNFLCIYYYMIGCAKRGHWSLIKYIYAVPFYWLMVSVAASKALHQLFFKPHFWEKTNHGLNLNKEIKQIREVPKFVENTIIRPARYVLTHHWMGGASLIAASVLSNFMNYLYNAYLGNNISLADFGLISLFGSFFYLTQVPFSAFSKSVTNVSGYFFGKDKQASHSVWSHFRYWGLVVSVVATVVWFAFTPYLKTLFKADDLMPFLIFGPVWIIGMLASIDAGFLSGTQRFAVLAVIGLSESISKFLFSVFFVSIKQTQLVYMSLPLSMTIAFVIGWYYARKVATVRDAQKPKFPIKFALTSILNKLSTIVFLGMDIIIAKIVLSPEDAGKFALISLIGKMVYFFSSLPGQFVIPMVSKEEGAKRNPARVFYQIFVMTAGFTLVSYIGLGVLGYFAVPLLFGAKTKVILEYLPFYLLGIGAFSLANTIISYHQSRHKFFIPVISFLISMLQGLYLWKISETLGSYVYLLSIFGIVQLLVASICHRLTRYSVAIVQNTTAFFDLLSKKGGTVPAKQGVRFLILNWRDTRHTWAGGAEVYVQELGKHLVKEGHRVTIFCGNDGNLPSREVIDGVEIERRGGHFTVYLWAALYYVFRFQDRFDIIIDSENGIPFFTPLYTRRPKFLLVHHIHKDFFRDNFGFPLRQIGVFLECVLMPIAYRSQKVIAVSESTRSEFLKLGYVNAKNVFVLNPGIKIQKSKLATKKTISPSLLYLGRLKGYKNVDVAIKAFAQVLKVFPDAVFNIAGSGEKMNELKKLAKDLKITKSVKFHGNVSEKTKKPALYRKSWLMIQPSSFEGWGITVIESNLFGTPVVASNIPGLRDSVIDGKTGILVKQKDVDGFAEAIIKVFKNQKLRERLGKNGEKRAKLYSWDEHARKFLNEVGKMIEEYRSADKGAYRLISVLVRK